MSQPIEESILKAIEKDDKKAFDAFQDTARRGAVRLGRFPVLSLLYLYGARRILAAYEEQFIKISSWEELGEPASVSAVFSDRAGKCLRLYLSETVSPVEMLLILDRTRRLKRVYPAAKCSNAVKERLKSIYFLKYALSIKFDGDDIILDKRPLTRREKKKIITAGACTALAVLIAVAAPVTAVSLIPKPVEGEVRKIEDIDFNSKKQYTLKKDLELPEGFSVEKVNCRIDGDGKKLTIKNGASLGELNGKLTNVTLETDGTRVFTGVTDNALIQNVTLNVDVRKTYDVATAFLTDVNYGTIEDVALNVTGTLCAVAAAGKPVEAELNFGGIAQTNAVKYSAVTQKYTFGTVKDCTARFTNFRLEGEPQANATFAGVVGVNNGQVTGCRTEGEITADTFDAAGLCVANTRLVSGCANAADIAHSSALNAAEVWNPISCGIVINNQYLVQSCENTGSISSSLTAPENENALVVVAAGVAYTNSGSITGCASSGAVSTAGGSVTYCAGIAALSDSLIENCLSVGDIAASGKAVYAGGIMALSDITGSWASGFYFGVAEKCISENKITVAADEKEVSCVGGIAGFIRQLGLNFGDSVTFIGGGVLDSFFIGENNFSGNYSGSIVGVVGENIYETNSYTSGNVEYHNFEGNYRLENSRPAFGAAVSTEGTFAEVADKGAVSAAEDVIKSTESFKNILAFLGK